MNDEHLNRVRRILADDFDAHSTSEARQAYEIAVDLLEDGDDLRTLNAVLSGMLAARESDIDRLCAEVHELRLEVQSHSREIHKEEDANRLLPQTVIRDADGVVWENVTQLRGVDPVWARGSVEDLFWSDDIEYPAQIIYNPEVSK